MTASTILHPTDFSPSATRAMQVAVRLAAATKGTLVLMHAELLHGADESKPRASLDEHAASAERKLRELSRDPPAVEAVLRRAMLADEAILDMAAERKADLIVCGTHGRRGVSRLFLGSVAERLLRQSPCPVVTARADSVVPDGILFRTLLVPMDMSVDSQRALALAGTLAENWDATIQLVHVVDPPPVMYYAGNITSRFDLDGDLRGRVEVRLRAAGEGLPVTRCIVAEGHPAVEIARVAYEPEIDLIVMSATGSATIDWLPMGSTTARVCRIARKPVLASR